MRKFLSIVALLILISTRGFLTVCFFLGGGGSFHAAGSQEHSIDNSLACTKVFFFALTALISI
jgi:hypothetical protein